MSQKCTSVFLVSHKPSKNLKDKIIAELEPSGNIHIHEIPPTAYKRRGSLAALIKTASTVYVCVDKSSVPASEIKIALDFGEPFHIVDKTSDGEGKVVHSSKYASSNLN